MGQDEVLVLIEQAGAEGWTELDLSGQELKEIPESIAQLSNLTTLNLGRNEISSIPESIAQLSNLTELDLRSNQISSIPESITKLSNLTKLSLSENQIRSIPDLIAQLSNLTELDLRFNQISSIPESITQLSNLTRLNLGGNQIRSIPESISKLSNLTTLILGYNQIRSIPESISKLSNLTKLSLRDNQISSIPEPIAQLSNLTTLDLYNNQINSIPEAIAQLSNLTTLNLGRNEISSIPESIAQLSNLTALNLRGNQIRFLPQGMQNLTKLKELDLQGNLLEIPPEILAPQAKENLADAGRILDYYFSEKTYIYEAKILIVGEGGAGKTSLANKLRDPAYQLRPEAVDISTEGIDILRWEFVGRDQKTYKVNIWDFGGQDIYHQTHQFFLTERAVYLLVADSRKEDTDHYWWLQVIRLLGKDSPVVLVQNEKQDCSCNLNFRELKAEFTLQIPKAINLATNRHLEELRIYIQRNLEDLLAKGTPFPKTWLAVRQALESDPRNYIDYGDYVSLCHKYNITRPEEISNLSQFLHDLGSCLHFQHDPILRQRLFLKPNWATTALYKILTNPAVKDNLGQFSDRDLKNIWQAPEYANLHHELLQLLKEFKICYEIPQHPGNYISPHLLSAEPRDYTWDDSNNLILRYAYRGFMPKGILTRFIVEMHRLIEQVTAPSQALVWKQGVVLNYEGRTRAEIIENSYDREIRLRFSGSNQRDFLVILDHEFQQIHKTYERLEYVTCIPCNCTKCKPSPHPHTYELKKLREFIEAHRPTIQCYESGEDVNVRRLLDDLIDTNFDQKFYKDNHELDLRSRERFSDRPIVINNNISNSPTAEANAMSQESKYTNNLQGANIANLVNEANDEATITATEFTQNSTTNTTELLQIVNNLRQTAAQFPPDIQEGIIIDLDDVETEIKKPENKRNLPRLKKYLAALLAAATLAGGAIASGVDFANNVVDLGSKVGIELKLPPAP